MTAGRKLDEPPGFEAVTFASTAMVVGGIGLAWTGLLLAAAGAILSVIEFKELQRRNPWLLPKVDPQDSPMLLPGPKRINRLSVATLVIAAGIALAAAQLTGEQLAALPPAILAGFSGLFFNAQMRKALARGAEPRSPDDGDETRIDGD